MAKNPDNPKKPSKTPKSKAHRPDVQPIGPALAELLNPAINRGDAGMGSGTGLRPPPDNSEDRRSGGEAALHRARASTRGSSDDVAKRDAVSSSPPPAQARGGEGSGVGGGAAFTDAAVPADRPPTPDPSPPRASARGGGEKRVSTNPRSANSRRPITAPSATIPTLDPELAKQLGFTTEEEDLAAMARPPRNKMEALGVAATADALESLIREGRPEFKGEDGQVKIWTPHRPPRPEKSEGGHAVRDQVANTSRRATSRPRSGNWSRASTAHDRTQVLLGVTGSGKTFTMAKVIEATQRPALILAPNKTLAAQLYGEFKSFFPDNAVEYFVCYYDYYQPEAYVPRTDTYIEKESSINEQIDRMRHSATRALLERDDVIIVASVSCIYGIGSVETYTAMTFALKKGERIDQRQLIADLVALQYKRTPGRFHRAAPSACAATPSRSSRPTMKTAPGASPCSATRSRTSRNSIRSPATRPDDLEFVKIYANSHYVTPRPTLQQAIKSIKAELKRRLDQLHDAGPPAGSAAAGAAHHLRSRDDGGHRLLRRHRELFALSHRPPARRAAADAVRIPPRQCAGVRRRKPRHRAADRRHVQGRLPAQGDAGRIRLPPALLHGQPPAAVRGMGRDAPADGRGVGHARRVGDGRRPAACSSSR